MDTFILFNLLFQTWLYALFSFSFSWVLLRRILAELCCILFYRSYSRKKKFHSKWYAIYHTSEKSDTDWNKRKENKLRSVKTRTGIAVLFFIFSFSIFPVTLPRFSKLFEPITPTDLMLGFCSTLLATGHLCNSLC